MNSKYKKLTALIVTCVIAVVSIITFAATRFPFAKVCFDGIRLQRVGDTTQGFVDITLKNIDATGISFCLTYDQTQLLLSNANTNVPIENPEPSGPITTNVFDTEHKYFIQNTDVFPAGIFKDNPMPPGMTMSTNLPIIGIADQDLSKQQGHLIMNFLPIQEANALCPNYIEKTIVDKIEYNTIMASKKGDLQFGSISFKIKDPAAFSKLKKKDIEKLIKIDSFSSMIKIDKNLPSSGSGVIEGTPIKIGADEGIQMSYINEDNDIDWYSNEEQNISAEFDLKVDIKEVNANKDHLELSAYEAYTYGEKTGTDADLFKLLNDRMSSVVITYSDNTQSASSIEWSREKSNVSETWDVKGGQYTISQPYDDEGKYVVTVTVTVNPVKLIGFTTENENLTYLLSQTEQMENLSELELPFETRPILDTYIPNGGIPEIGIGWYSFEAGLDEITEIPAQLKTGTGTFEFIGHLDSDPDRDGFHFPEECPWLTMDNPAPQITVYRHVVDTEEKLPDRLIVDSSRVDDNGHLIIKVRYENGPISALTEFNIKMPGGELIDLAELENNGRYKVTVSDGTIELWADPNWDNPTTERERKENKLAQLINLGNRGGSFSIAAAEPDKVMGSYTDFAPNSRRNIYLYDDSGNNYVFDYSGLNSALFPVREGASLPTTLTLPLASDRINTTYSGYDGTEKGHLSTFSVDSWKKTDPTAPETAGSVVEVTGTLIDTSYTNYGIVTNQPNLVTVTIKYYVTENDDVDSIEAIPNAVYDKRQVGYDYDDLQTKTFTVKNNGTTDIYGLTAVISLSNVKDREAFVMTKELSSLLKSGQSTEMDVSTRIGLPLENDADTEYVCTVFILSENKPTPLQQFSISFTVTKKPTYNIKLEVNDTKLGEAKTSDEAYTAHEGDVITIEATPEADCVFVNWTVEKGSVSLADSTSSTTTFSMPASNVTIKANFKETTMAKLRLEDLMVKDLADNSQTLHDSNWQVMAFDPTKDTYYVAVPNDVDKVKLWFKLRSEGEGADLEVIHEYGDPPGVTSITTTPAPIKDSVDNYYKSAEIELQPSPTENLVTLTISKPEEADEGSPPESSADPSNPSASPAPVIITRTYKIHIYQRKKVSELVTFNYGNSPYGLIMRDGTLNSTQQQDYKDAFVNNGYKFVDGVTPAGGTKDLVYTTKAWTDSDSGITGNNYDLSDIALFAIGDESFSDPGYSSITNSIGKTVTTVLKKVRVNLLTQTTRDGSSDDFVYIAPTTIGLSSSGPISELVGKTIRPGCYDMVYYFTDFDGKTMEVKKPLIVLPEVGDINVTGNADNVDASRIISRFGKDIADHENVPDHEDSANQATIKFDTDGLLFRYRVCDVNNDGHVNAIDSNYIRAQDLNPYYKNLSEGGGT